MEITYDVNKNIRNVATRGLSFERAADFDFETAMFAIDDRHDYNETRIVATGYLDSRLHVLCFIETTSGIRVISFRKENPREIKYYDAQKNVN